MTVAELAFVVAGALWLYALAGALRHPDSRRTIQRVTLALLAAVPVIAAIGLWIALR